MPWTKSALVRHVAVVGAGEVQSSALVSVSVADPRKGRDEAIAMNR